MKSLFLIIAILFATTTFAQKTYYCSSTIVGEYNYYTQKYVWGDYKPSSMEITVKKNIVLINDQAGSVYILSSKLLDEKSGGIDQIAWNAKDEKNRNCIVKLTTYEDYTMMLYVMYDDMAIGYTIKL